MQAVRKTMLFGILFGLSMVLGVMVADVLAGYQEWCDPTSIGASCSTCSALGPCRLYPPSYTCTPTRTTPYGACVPSPFWWCTRVTSCAGKCADGVTDCSCPITGNAC